MTGSKWPRGRGVAEVGPACPQPGVTRFRRDFNQFLVRLGDADCDLIGINDYFSVAGYREVVPPLGDPAGDTEGNAAYRDALEKLRCKVLLPIVECRMTNVLINKQGKGGQRLNFHLIFDPALDPDDIETFLKNQQPADDRSAGGTPAASSC